MKPSQILAFIFIFAVGSACASFLFAFPLLLLAVLGGLVGWLIGVQIAAKRRQRLMDEHLRKTQAARDAAVAPAIAWIMGRSPALDSPNVISIHRKRHQPKEALW